jgi:hypothetical protein
MRENLEFPEMFFSPAVNRVKISVDRTAQSAKMLTTKKKCTTKCLTVRVKAD